MILVKNDQIPVGGVNPFVISLDAAGFAVDAEKILKGTETDDRPLFVGALVLGVESIRRVVGVTGDKLPALKIEMSQQILPPGGLNGGLKSFLKPICLAS